MSITRIVITVSGEEITMTMTDAKKLYEELNELFSKTDKYSFQPLVNPWGVSRPSNPYKSATKTYGPETT